MNNIIDKKEQSLLHSSKKRCEQCKKKSLYIHKCKCNMLLCLKHLNYCNHDCKYDFKKDKIMEEQINFKKIDVI